MQSATVPHYGPKVMAATEASNKSSQDELSESETKIPAMDGKLCRENTRIQADIENDDARPAPDGGFEAWLVAVGSFCIFFSCMGFANSFGTMADYYITHQLREESADDIAWIGSLSAFLQFFSGMVGGPLFDKFGAKACLHLSISFETLVDY